MDTHEDQADIRLIKQLSTAPGVSGFEDPVIDVAKKYLDKGFKITEDRLRNLFIRQTKTRKNRPVVMLDAHSDEVGFMIQSVNPNGTLKFMTLGGWSPQNLMAQPVRVQNTKGRWIKGVVAAKPNHFMSADEMKQQVPLSDMMNDVGACSKKEVETSFHIRIGAPVAPDTPFFHDKPRGLIFGKAFDDRLGCAALLQLMKHHSRINPEIDVCGVFSSQEELGLRGASVSVRNINPDLAIVLEGTPADDTFNSSDFIQAGMGKGPQIRHMDRSVLANPRFVRFAVDVARTCQIPFQEAVRSSGGTNAGVITYHDRSVPTITLGIPVRYIHSHNSIASLSDFNHAVEWCREILKSLTPEVIEGF